MPPKLAKGLFITWLVLLIPWVFMAGLSLMFFDGGTTLEAWAGFCSVWMYPLMVGMVAIFRKKHPGIVFLPFATPIIALIIAPIVAPIINSLF
ncbi:MAG: hypothetical protein LAN36_13620 [Acidobacteriia bacterium]|nr:hypothetical protein [Terriglobia bacterium]